jgi:hypothetical protein
MPIVPVSPLGSATVAGHHTQPTPTASGAFAAAVHNALTAKAVKPSSATANPRVARRATETDNSLDEETNTLDAKAHFRPGNHIVDVEA